MRTPISSAQFRKDAAVGKYLLEHGPSTMAKDAIYRNHIAPPKAPKVSKPKDTVDTSLLEYYKAGHDKWVALMDYMGDKADAVLAKALSVKG